MSKTILITGSTDGIGLETAKILLQEGHRVLLHGRNSGKLDAVASELSSLGTVESYLADLSNLNEVIELANAIKAKHHTLDVLINNAGVLKTANPLTNDGFDIRFIVNTIAPYLLMKELLPLLGEYGRVLNLSSAAQAPVDLDALAGKVGPLADMEAYSQNKLAITMWSQAMANEIKPVIIAVNPGSLLASKMVKEGFGVAGGDLGIGVDILMRAALSDEFAEARGKYFDNDSRRFAAPHPDGLNEAKCRQVVEAIEDVLARLA